MTKPSGLTELYEISREDDICIPTVNEWCLSLLDSRERHLPTLSRRRDKLLDLSGMVTMGHTRKKPLQNWLRRREVKALIIGHSRERSRSPLIALQTYNNFQFEEALTLGADFLVRIR